MYTPGQEQAISNHRTLMRIEQCAENAGFTVRMFDSQALEDGFHLVLETKMRTMTRLQTPQVGCGQVLSIEKVVQKAHHLVFPLDWAGKPGEEMAVELSALRDLLEGWVI